MAICLGMRVVADVRYRGISGVRVAGGFVLRLSIDFDVKNWTEQDGPAPTFRAVDAPVTLAVGAGILLGHAHPETTLPFRVSSFSSSSGLLYSLSLTHHAMEQVEAARAGGSVLLKLRIRGELSRLVLRAAPPGQAGKSQQSDSALAQRIDSESERVDDEVACRISQSDWLAALEGCGYGSTLLFEIPVPAVLSDGGTRALKFLASARQALVEGRYDATVAHCRDVLDSLTKELKQTDDLSRAKSAHGATRLALTAPERELRIRAAILDYAHLAHHPAETELGHEFDRTAAKMMLGVTASLVSAALERAVKKSTAS